MTWQDHGTHHSLYRGGARVAQIRWFGNLYTCHAFPPGKPPQAELEVTLDKAKAWAEEATR